MMGIFGVVMRIWAIKYTYEVPRSSEFQVQGLKWGVLVLKFLR